MSAKVPMKLQAAQATFESTREAITAFRAANPKLVERFENLKQAYNDSLNEVKSLYRENAEQVGDHFHDFSVRHKTLIDGERLVELAGDTGLACCTLKYSVDRKEYNKLVEAGLITQEVVDEVESEGPPSIYGPKAL